MHKKILLTMLVFFFLAAAVYSAGDSCEGKGVCLQNDLSGSKEKIEELYNLNIGGIGYLDIGERSEDLSLSAGAIYEAGRTAKELALLRAQYEGIGKEELIVEHRIITTTEKDILAEDAPDFTEEDITEIDIVEEFEEEPETSIESYNIRLNDRNLFSRDYFVRFKNGKWEWCKNPVFGSCDDKKFNFIGWPSKKEAGEFYEILSALEKVNSEFSVPYLEKVIYEEGLVNILRKLVFLRLGDSEMILEIGDSKVDIEADTIRVVERFGIIIGNKKAFVSGGDDVRKFITMTEDFRPQFENIFQEFKNLATKEELRPSQTPEARAGRFVNITSENSGNTGAEICEAVPGTMPTKARECYEKIIIINPNEYALKKIYSCEAFIRSPESFETAFSAVFCESL